MSWETVICGYRDLIGLSQVNLWQWIFTIEIEDIDPIVYQSEMKRKPINPVNLLTTHTPSVSTLLDPKRFSSVHRLFHVTGLVIKFVQHVMSLVGRPLCDSRGCLEQAKLYWIMECQSCLISDNRFESWKRQLNLYRDKLGIWRYGGRMAKSCLSLAAQNPILLDKNHHLTELIFGGHHRVFHNGVRDTLTELRSEYWLVKGQQFVRKLIHKCVICKRHEGKSCQTNPPPPLPEFRVQQSRPFQTTGVDFAGSLCERTK